MAMLECGFAHPPRLRLSPFMKIVFYSPGKNSQPWLDSFNAQLPGSEVWAWSPECSDQQADYAVLWAPPAELFATQRNLKAIFNIGAGADRVLEIPGLEQLIKGVPVVRLNDAGMAVQMAEYVCHALIRHTREFAAYDEQQKQCEWKTRPAIEREAWPVGVMGLGEIGARVAQSVAGFGYPTFGWSRTAKTLPGICTFAGSQELDAFLGQVRVLVCVLALTDETRGILNARMLGKLKPNGYLINVARGAHLVESELISMLDHGQLAGATLDVFQEEPLVPMHPFWLHPKITLTPHISAITQREESVAQIVGKMRALERGESIAGVIRWTRGY